MAFVKLDCGMLNSTLWVDRQAREIMITALLMAQPKELQEDTPTLRVRTLEVDPFVVPAGWYGFVPAAGSGIVRMAGLQNEEGLDALERLADIDPESRTPDFDGRRIVRVDGGYVILNFDKYRQKDHTAAERSRRYRERKLSAYSNITRVTNVTSRVATRSVTQAEAEAEAEGGRIEKATLSLAPSQAIAWTVADGFTGISDKDRADWKEAYPACDIPRQLAAAHQWLLGNPTKAKKKQWRKFVTGWLSRSQERGGDAKSNPPAASKDPRMQYSRKIE